MAAALSYITCSSAGELVCRDRDCWCRCAAGFPDCNCPDADVRAMESSLLQVQAAWATHGHQFEQSGSLPANSTSHSASPGLCWWHYPRARSHGVYTTAGAQHKKLMVPFPEVECPSRSRLRGLPQPLRVISWLYAIPANSQRWDREILVRVYESGGQRPFNHENMGNS